MGAVVPPRVPRGMRDILPDKMILRQYVEGVIRDVFESFSFQPLATPAVELAETLMGKYGPDAEKLIYDVKHREGKEDLALRYDLSVPLCRVAAMYPELPKPFKRYQIAPVWRAERPQKGRYREFYQCDADTVGTTSILADAEILNVVYEILRRLGFRRYVIHINNRKILKGIGQFVGLQGELLAKVYRAIDKLDKIGLDGVQNELREGGIDEPIARRLLDLLRGRGEQDEVLTSLQRQLADFPVALEGIHELEQIADYLRAVGIPRENYAIDFAMVRGLEYYTGPIFETIVEEPKIGSITGGGRYDDLIGVFSGKSLPATGTTIGIERIIVVMDELNMYPPDVRRTVSQVLVTVFDSGTLDASLTAAQELRTAGFKVELYLESSQLGDQIRYALKRGIPYVIILGPDELSAGQVVVRNLERKLQEKVDRGRMVDTLNGWKSQ
jgi:histidyl-tRNA synthetase